MGIPSRIDHLVVSFLPPSSPDALGSKVTLLIEESEGDERHPQVRGGLAVIAGEMPRRRSRSAPNCADRTPRRSTPRGARAAPAGLPEPGEFVGAARRPSTPAPAPARPGTPGPRRPAPAGRARGSSRAPRIVRQRRQATWSSDLKSARACGASSTTDCRQAREPLRHRSRPGLPGAWRAVTSGTLCSGCAVLGRSPPHLG